MIENELITTIDELVHPGKGILAADESNGTMGKRLATIDVQNTEQNRRAYRSILFGTHGLSQYINGVILFEETLDQQDDNGKLLTEVLSQQGILPGIKVDKGLVEFPNTVGEKITQGLDGLKDRLVNYKEKGARFAKWRNVYNISDTSPSYSMIKAGAEVLARYAAICQTLGIVPIVEPEVLMDGTHDIDQSASVTELVLHELFHALFIHQVELEYIVLKPSMVISGSNSKEENSPEEVADYTVSMFRNHVPAAVPSINFLSGGQSPQQATSNLNAINLIRNQPWQLSFSYGRALQEPSLAAWQGNNAHTEQAQAALLKRAQLNSLATLGEYSPDMEKE